MIDHASNGVWCMAGYTYSQQLAETKNKAKPSKSFDEMVPEPYHEYKKVFSEEESERLPEHQSWDHAIGLVLGAPPNLKTKIYPMSLNKQAKLDKFLEEKLKKGYICPLNSPMASPVFFVKKKDRKLCFVQDY